MANVSALQNSFTAGELSPRLFARSDTTKFSQGLAEILNFVVLPFGGLVKRSGTRFIGPTKNNHKPYFIPFRFATNDCVVIVATDNNFQFLRDRGYIAKDDAPYDLEVPYAQDELEAINWAQTGNHLYLFHRNHPPRRLVRNSLTDWSLETIEFKDGPWMDLNSDQSKTITLSGTSGTVTATANTAVFNVTTDIGRLLRIGPINKWGWGVITAVASTTSATVQLKGSPGSTGARWEWRLGAFYAGNYPACGCFFEERLWLANTPTQPQTMWGSRTNDFSNFAPTVYVSASATEESIPADAGLNYTLASDDLVYIRHIVPNNRLAILTDAAEFTATGGTTGITPLNIKINRYTTRGSSNVRPISIDSAIYFWQRGNLQGAHANKLREYVYQYTTDSFTSEEISIFSEHIAKPGITSQTYQQSPNSIIWAVREDGLLIGLTINKQQQVLAYHKHDTQGKFTAVTAIPGRKADDLYVSVLRNSNYYIEIFEDEFEEGDEYYFLDSFIDAEFDEPVSKLTGLGHLIGQEVVVMSDNSIVSESRVNSNGEILLYHPDESPIYVTNARVGLPYVSCAKSLNYPQGQNDGNSVSKTGRIHRLGIHQHQALGLEYGTDLNSTMHPYLYRRTTDPMGKAPPLSSEVSWVTFPGDFTQERLVYIRSQQPYPCTVLALIPWLSVNN